METTRSEALFARAQTVIPGGVNSPVRAFSGVGGSPRFVARGDGSRIIDEDGNSYLDLVGSWGPLALGHCHPDVVAAAVAAIERGSSFGAPTEGEIALAEDIVDAVDSVEMVRLVNSGTEAAMTALRLARGATARDKVLKFVGHYHGHSDALLVAAGSGVATLGIPGSPGVTAGAAQDTLLVDWNDRDGVDEVVSIHGGDLAAIICEPIPANMNLAPADEGFLEFLRDRATSTGAVLVFDEVISGFRIGRGGAQGLYGVRPDLTVLGKVIGGGFPLAAFGGSREIMQHLAPSGPVYQAGTLSGNPVAVAAGRAQLALLDDAAYARLRHATDRLVDGLRRAFSQASLAATVTQVGTIAGIVFGADRPRRFADIQAADHATYGRFFHAMLDRGVYLAPSGYEVLFTSTALTDADLDEVVAAAHGAAVEVAASVERP